MSPKTITGAELDLDDGPARGADLFLVDGNNLAYRAFFALPEELATSDGLPTNALLGFGNMLFKLLADYRPRGVAVAWDTRPVHRAAAAEAVDVVYKQGRKPMPDLLREQFPHFRPIVEAFGYRNLEFEGWEADDVIATIATRADEAGVKTCVVSTDRDAFQLCSENVTLMMTPSRRLRRERLHARARRAPLRRSARSGAGLHRAQGRLVGQHPGHSRDRRQDGRAADRPVRIARGGDRARGRPLPGARQGRTRERRSGTRVEGPRDDAPRSPARRRSDSARLRGSRSFAVEGDVSPLRVSQPAQPRRRARRGRTGSGAREARGSGGRLERRRSAHRSWHRRGGDRGRSNRGGGRGSRARCRLGSRPVDLPARRRDRRARRQGAEVAVCPGRRHDARRLPDRARPLGLPDRRPRSRVRDRARARACCRGDDRDARPARRGDEASGRADARAARRAGLAGALRANRASAHRRPRGDGDSRREDRHLPDGRDHGPVTRSRRGARGQGDRPRGRGVHARFDAAGGQDSLREARARAGPEGEDGVLDRQPRAPRAARQPRDRAS